MKVDGLGVVLAIILLPILLVVTYYIQMQVDTIALENQYNTKLLDATYDAMSAFEMNTANEELSTVADSMRSIVLASNNVFLNSLATNLGMSNASKQNLQPYIPAVLYTMYDGYYIYAPTETPKVAEKTVTETLEDGDVLTKTKGHLSIGDADITKENTEGFESAVYGDIIYEADKEKSNFKYTVNRAKAKTERDYILKSYVQYSARYQIKQNDNIIKDVAINYTLDNYLNIVGKIRDIYYTKTGYLIKKGLVESADIDGNFDLQNSNENDAKNKILGLNTNAQESTKDAAKDVTVTLQDQKDPSKKIQINASWPDELDKSIRTISDLENYLEKNPNNEYEYIVQQYKAAAYYVSSACFSNWVYDNLGDLQYKHIVDRAMTGYYTDEEGNAQYETTLSSGVNDLFYSFANNTNLIFDKLQDPESFTSNFNTHKMEVIKNSIKYNLNLSMAAYNNIYSEYEASMPILVDEEWDKILSNISIVSFMQGWDCGLDIYNNYQIVSSTNNELTVTPSEIYYVKKTGFNNSSDNYHRLDCPYLPKSTEGYISFKSKEVKYDKTYEKSAVGYKYDHKNLACYTCINTNNYKNDGNYKEIWDDADKVKAKYIALANERQNIYKTNALPFSEGYKIILKDEIGVINGSNITVERCDKNKVKEIQITISDTKSHLPDSKTSREPIAKLDITVGGKIFKNVAINLDQTKEQTIILDLSDTTYDITTAVLAKSKTDDGTATIPNYQITYKVKSIKAIYK